VAALVAGVVVFAVAATCCVVVAVVVVIAAAAVVVVVAGVTAVTVNVTFMLIGHCCLSVALCYACDVIKQGLQRETFVCIGQVRHNFAFPNRIIWTI